MLKIKESVDLKELEKFGFEYKNYTGKYEYSYGHYVVYVNSWNREIYGQMLDKSGTFLFNQVYDLIKADMVEKVEE